MEMLSKSIYFQFSEVYTIFSPEDTAFDQALIDTLLADADLLTRFLNYHMTSGNVTLAFFENDATLTTLEGTTVRTNIYDSVSTYPLYTSKVLIISNLKQRGPMNIGVNSV